VPTDAASPPPPRYRWAVLAIGAGSTAAMAAVAGRALLRPLVADEDRRRREPHARLARQAAQA
jgi:hypothetical protein